MIAQTVKEGNKRYLSWQEMRELVSNIIFDQLVSEAGAIIAVSRSVASKLVLRGVSENIIRIIANGVSPD